MESILLAREERWIKKSAMVKSLSTGKGREAVSLVTLTLRMPAPLRISGSYDDLALSIHADLVDSLRRKSIAVLRQEFRVTADGPESYIAVRFDAASLKRAVLDFEKEHPLGELADLDVTDSEGNTIGRSSLGEACRTCLVCQGDAAACVVGRRHTIREIEAKVRLIIAKRKGVFAGRSAADRDGSEDRRIGRLALTATLFEASASPKPGLVDPYSKGAHRDMDYATFLASAAALAPWFVEFARLGRLHQGDAAQLLPPLRETGKAAERDMFAATKGVNTHKGLIFSLGLLCAAAGRLKAAGRAIDPRDCASGAAEIAAGIVARDFSVLRNCEGRIDAERNNRESLRGAMGPATETVPPHTAGERLYLVYGARGIRGEAEEGFPSVVSYALPRFRAGLAAGLSTNDAMIDALLVLCEVVEDTNVMARAGREGLNFLRAEASRALSLGGMAVSKGREAVVAMGTELVNRNISPGGCADLLAVTVFLEMLERGSE